MVVPAGPCHLLVSGPDGNYVVHSLGSDVLQTGKPGGVRRYYHGVLALDLAPQDQPKEVALILQRGITLHGRVLGPDGKPVPHAFLLCDTELACFDGIAHREDSMTLGQPIEVKDGSFELPGCNPERRYRLSFIDAARMEPVVNWHFKDNEGVFGVSYLGLLARSPAKLAATVEVRPEEGKPLTVRLGPCGSAQVRLVDDQGKAAKGYRVWLEHVFKSKPAPAEAAVVAAPFPAPGDRGTGDVPVSADAEGRVKFPVLIPGATYRLRVTAGRKPYREIIHEQEFRAEPGKMLKLPDIVLK
jgi:hypothetical protein